MRGSTFRELNTTSYKDAVAMLQQGEVLAVSFHSAKEAAGSGYYDVSDETSFKSWMRHRGIKVMARKKS